MTELLLAPHHDDSVLFAAFTVMRWRPKVVVVFESHLQEQRGDRLGGDLITNEMRQREEWAALCEMFPGELTALGASEAPSMLGTGRLEFWPYRDDDPVPDYDQMRRDIAGLEADRIYAPAYIHGGHDQHNGVALAAEHGAQCELVRYLTYRRGAPDERVESQVPAPVEPEWVARKLRALACHRSQIHLWPHHFLSAQHEFYA